MTEKSKYKVRFGKDISMVHIPFTPSIGAYHELEQQLSRLVYPKSTKYISARLEIVIGIKGNYASYRIADMTINK